MNATINLEKKHFPVLLDELISIISPLYGGTFIDCTFGQGGYSKKILSNKNNKVVALDRDPETLIEAKKLIKNFKGRFRFENEKFSNINELKISNQNLRAIIFDLGYSIHQINDSRKGLSFYSKGKLNMRLGKNFFSADDVINKMSYENLNKVFKFFGDEQKSKIIAKNIIKQRSKKKILSEDLVNIIERAKKKHSKINKSTKVFQSLRILVNNEISQLIFGLINSFKLLPVGGILAVVTFHSLEDKIVKFFFKNYSEKKKTSRYLPELKDNKKIFKLINKKPITPSSKEIILNPPSRSAKLRCAQKIENCNNFDEFVKKFEYLIKIEELAD
mgnify:FL=1